MRKIDIDKGSRDEGQKIEIMREHLEKSAHQGCENVNKEGNRYCDCYYYCSYRKVAALRDRSAKTSGDSSVAEVQKQVEHLDLQHVRHD